MPQIFIKGPNHPDLFGGETPIMVPLGDEVKAFKVRASAECVEIASDRVSTNFYLLCKDEDEARSKSRELFEDRYSGSYDEIQDFYAEVDEIDCTQASDKIIERLKESLKED